MAILRYNDIQKMNDNDRASKLKDLKIELIKSQVTANKTNAKTREIKRAIARILTNQAQAQAKAPVVKAQPKSISTSAKGGAEKKK